MQPDERIRVWTEHLERHIRDLAAWVEGAACAAGPTVLHWDDLEAVLDRLDALRYDMVEAIR